MNPHAVTPADGSAVAAPARRLVESRHSGAGHVIASYESADEAAVAAAVARARAAQPAWAARSPEERARFLQRFHDVLYRRRDEAAALVSRELGKPLVDAVLADVTVTLEFATWYAKAAPRFLREPWRVLSTLLFWRKRVRMERRPYGITAIISPWNYPLWLPASGAMPALLCGNAVIIKPSEYTPACAELLVDLWREAGLPDGVFQVVQGDGVTGRALVRGGVDQVFFTGSTAAGRQVARDCAEQLIPCSLELGGSDAAIVLADADLPHAANGLTWARFFNAGQNCVSPKRIFVEAPAYDAFVRLAADAVRSLRVGPPDSPATEVGPLIRPVAAATVRAQCDDALARGARVAAQAAAPETDRHFPPTLLVDVTPGMRVLAEETFGPIMPVVKVADADEAVRLANDSRYGLSASVWTADRARGLAVARRLEAGSVVINDAVTVFGAAEIPTGGVKESGLGRHRGVHSLEECVRSIPVMDDRFARWRQPWWHGYGAAHLGRLAAYQRLMHGRSLAERLSGLWGTIALTFSRGDRD